MALDQLRAFVTFLSLGRSGIEAQSTRERNVGRCEDESAATSVKAEELAPFLRFRARSSSTTLFAEQHTTSALPSSSFIAPRYNSHLAFCFLFLLSFLGFLFFSPCISIAVSALWHEVYYVM